MPGDAACSGGPDKPTSSATSRRRDGSGGHTGRELPDGGGGGGETPRSPHPGRWKGRGGRPGGNRRGGGGAGVPGFRRAAARQSPSQPPGSGKITAATTARVLEQP